MFTGIVEEVGRVLDISARDESAVLTITGPGLAKDATSGGSIAVNGACLTVVGIEDEAFYADVMGETLSRTNLGDLIVGDDVNLEQAMPANGRFGGHIVSGHIDTTVSIVSRHARDGWELLEFTLPPEVARYIVTKGSVALDGVSLTVIDVDQSRFSVGLIPTTLARTTFGRRQVGQRVNLEVDILAKHVEKLVAGSAP